MIEEGKCETTHDRRKLCKEDPEQKGTFISSSCDLSTHLYIFSTRSYFIYCTYFRSLS